MLIQQISIVTGGEKFMTFRQDAIVHRQFKSANIIISLLCLGMIPFVELYFAVILIIACIILWILFIFKHDNFITIDEKGIFCHTSKEQLWRYEWECIAQLRKGSYLSSRGIYVITYSKSGEPEPYAVSGHCFQLGKEAKQAIEKYYKPIADLPKR